MNHPLQRRVRRLRGISWVPVLFLLVFLAVLGVSALLIVEPMLRKAAQAAPQERQRLSAYTALLICILLLLLLLGMLFTLRLGQKPPTEEKPKPTVYPDAWAESARRLQTPAAEDLEGEDEDKNE